MKENSLDTFLISKLISKALLNELTAEETAQFDTWLNQSDENRKLFDSYKNCDAIHDDLQIFNSLNMGDGWRSVKEKIANVESETTNLKPRKTLGAWFYKYRIANIAATIILIGLAAFLTFPFNSDPGVVKDISGQYKNDVLPGKDRAQLVLSSGEVVDLQESVDGLSEKDGTLIKSEDGRLSYFARSSKKNPDESIFNTLRVPKGGNYQITLPDGTRVWLNSESELRFPVSFGTASRNVSLLKGEAFFEVAKDISKPFLVEVNGVKVQVLGTQFNVNAYYSDIRTTLLEGSVKLLTSNSSVTLKPGQLGSFDSDKIDVRKADIRKVLAWRNGEFYFKGDRFADILDQVALWYDLDIEMEKSMADISITGSIARDVKLSEVLSMLKYITQGQFELKGRTLTVRN